MMENFNPDTQINKLDYTEPQDEYICIKCGDKVKLVIDGKCIRCSNELEGSS